jgi:hypothetical protein
MTADEYESLKIGYHKIGKEFLNLTENFDMSTWRKVRTNEYWEINKNYNMDDIFFIREITRFRNKINFINQQLKNL